MNKFLFSLVLASLAVFAQMAPFDDKLEVVPEEEVDEAGPWTSYETEVDLTTGLNHTYPAISYAQSIERSQDVTKNKLYIKTLNWPNNYPRRYIHTWHFTARRGYVVKITFNKIFDVQYDGRQHSCFDDYVEIDDYFHTERFCGYNRPESYTSKSSRFTLKFKSDKSAVGRGFFATVEQAAPAVKPKVEIVLLNGQVVSGKFNVKAGKFVSYAHVVGAGFKGYQFYHDCVNKKGEQILDESNEPGETVSISSESDDDVSMSSDDDVLMTSDDDVSMTSEKHRRRTAKFTTFPTFSLNLKKGHDKVCYIKAYYSYFSSRYFKSNRIEFHVI